MRNAASRSGHRFWAALNVVLSVLFGIILLAIVAMVVIERTSSGPLPRIGGYFVASVLSGSMTPYIDTGDMIVDRPVTAAEANNLHVGQVITFRTGAKYHGQPMLVTHRIIGVLTISQKGSSTVQRLYRTKGDANQGPDPWLVKPQAIVGVYAWRIPYGGYLTTFIHQPTSFAIFIGLPILYLIGDQFLRMWRAISEADRRKQFEGQEAAAGEGGGDIR